MRIRDYGVVIGEMPTGRLNKISDVPGVTVGHSTIAAGKHNTGVTVIMTSDRNPFHHKLPAAAFVLNGFGKSQGLVQVEELGQLETPIALTNTLNVGLVWDAMVEYVLQRCAADGLFVPSSINPVVCECNDARLSDIRKRVVGQKDVFDAIASAMADFEEGAVGAGRGTVCHGLKGGIGTASRQMEYDGKTYTLGVLVQSNYGRLSDLRIDGRPVGKEIASGALEEDKGSIIVVMGTDLPLSDRQIKRVLRRTGVGLARVGSFTGHGSGEVFVGFSTANAMESDDKAVRTTESFREDLMNGPFRAMAEATEEAVLNSMSCSVSVGDVKSLADYLPKLLKR